MHGQRCVWSRRIEINNKPLQQQLHKKNQKCLSLNWLHSFQVYFCDAEYIYCCFVHTHSHLSVLRFFIFLSACCYRCLLLSLSSFRNKKKQCFVCSLAFFYSLNSQYIFVMCSNFNSHVLLFLAGIKWIAVILLNMFSFIQPIYMNVSQFFDVPLFFLHVKIKFWYEFNTSKSFLGWFCSIR